MTPKTRYLMLSHALMASFVALGCSDKITQVVAPEPTLDSVRVTASVRWNQRAERSSSRGHLPRTRKPP